MSLAPSTNRTSFGQPDAVPQASTRIYTSTLRDAYGVPLDPSDVSSIKLTLTNLFDDSIINGRSAQEVKNANGGTLAAQGAFSLILEPADNPVTDPDTAHLFEQHRLCFDVTHTGGRERHEVYLYVQRMSCAA